MGHGLGLTPPKAPAARAGLGLTPPTTSQGPCTCSQPHAPSSPPGSRGPCTEPAAWELIQGLCVKGSKCPTQEATEQRLRQQGTSPRCRDVTVSAPSTGYLSGQQRVRCQDPQDGDGSLARPPGTLGDFSSLKALCRASCLQPAGLSPEAARKRYLPCGPLSPRPSGVIVQGLSFYRSTGVTRAARSLQIGRASCRERVSSPV